MNILCIPTSKVRPFLEAGRKTYIGEMASEIVALLCEHGVWVERKNAEDDPHYRQVIPYITVFNTDLNKRLLMTRMTKQGEARLHGKEYIGVGGHIDQQSDDEVPALHCLPDAAFRELAEETGFTHGSLEYKAVVCIDGEDASMVDRVHLGVVYEYRTPEKQFITEEADQHKHRWATDDELRAAFPNMEVWSQCVMRDFLKLV
jgi:predicted NUDIX family phosphoesterase